MDHTEVMEECPSEATEQKVENAFIQYKRKLDMYLVKAKRNKGIPDESSTVDVSDDKTSNSKHKEYPNNTKSKKFTIDNIDEAERILKMKNNQLVHLKRKNKLLKKWNKTIKKLLKTRKEEYEAEKENILKEVQQTKGIVNDNNEKFSLIEKEHEKEKAEIYQQLLKLCGGKAGKVYHQTTLGCLTLPGERGT